MYLGPVPLVVTFSAASYMYLLFKILTLLIYIYIYYSSYEDAWRYHLWARAKEISSWHSRWNNSDVIL